MDSYGFLWIPLGDKSTVAGWVCGLVGGWLCVGGWVAVWVCGCAGGCLCVGRLKVMAAISLGWVGECGG